MVDPLWTCVSSVLSQPVNQLLWTVPHFSLHSTNETREVDIHFHAKSAWRSPMQASIHQHAHMRYFDCSSNHRNHQSSGVRAQVNTNLEKVDPLVWVNATILLSRINPNTSHYTHASHCSEHINCSTSVHLWETASPSRVRTLSHRGCYCGKMRFRGM